MRPALHLIALMTLSSILYGQTYTITGVVRDSETNEILPFATVFMAETSYAVVADDTGAYELIISEKGSYNLVARYAGYNAYNESITLDQETEIKLDIALKPSSKNLGSFVVTARHAKLWREQLKEFKTVFLGETSNAEACKILNEEDLDFYFDEEKNTLYAYSDKPLRIINNALGYEMEYFLDEFYFDKSSGLVLNNGNMIYKELQTRSRKKKDKWQAERKRAYLGSVRHFLSALFHNQLEEQGFIVKYAKNVPDQGISIPEGNINPAEYIVPGKSKLSRKLFFRDFLYITFPGEQEEKNFYEKPNRGISGAINISFGPSRNGQTSWISMVRNDTPLEFEENGFIYNPLSFFSYGYWSFEKVADLVPTNYKPTEN